jgi:hypothetical protein
MDGTEALVDEAGGWGASSLRRTHTPARNVGMSHAVDFVSLVSRRRVGTDNCMRSTIRFLPKFRREKDICFDELRDLGGRKSTVPIARGSGGVRGVRSGTDQAVLVVPHPYNHQISTSDFARQTAVAKR